MHFVHRVRTIWSWLPAFRAVAESEHLPTAANELGIVPSSLSRTVKQIEDELGIPLFDRTSKALVLNHAGRTLVAAVREAMRIVDDAVGTAVGDDLTGQVGAVANSELGHAILIPAAASLAASHPSLVLTALTATPENIPSMLLRGDADAAVIDRAIPTHPDLRVTELATWNRAAYVRGVPAEGREHRCVSVGTPSEPLDDGWPTDLDRRIAAHAPDERAALELCTRMDVVVVAYEMIVRRSGFASRLTRLDAPAIAPRALYLVQRRAVGRHRRTEALAEAIRLAATSLD